MVCSTFLYLLKQKYINQVIRDFSRTNSRFLHYNKAGSFKNINYRPMRNRNTIGDQWKSSQRNQTNSVERKTINNPQHQHQGPNKNLSQQQSLEKMGRTINNALMRLPSQGKRSSISLSSNVVQSKAKDVISNVGAFMTLIDSSFDKSMVDFEVVQQLLSFWGYPHNYNKSVFQTVGAPHTWHTCMQIMEFLAEVGIYGFEYKAAANDYKLDTEEIDLILDAFARDDPTDAEAYLINMRDSLTKEEQELAYKIESSELTLNNIRNSQRSIAQMEVEESQLQQKYDREKQLVIDIDQKNNILLTNIQRIDDEMEEQSLIQATLLKKIAMLEEEISNQELSLEQATKFESEIRLYTSKIKQVENEMLENKKDYEGQKAKVVEQFHKVVDDLNQIKASMKKYHHEMQERNMEITTPQYDHGAFTDALHAEDMTSFNESLSKVIEVDKVKSMLAGQESLADLLEHEIRVLSSQLSEAHSRKKSVEETNHEGFKEVENLQKYYEDSEREVEALTQKRQKIQEHIALLKEKCNEQNTINQELIQVEIALTEETKARKQSMMKGIQMLTKYEAEGDRTIKELEQKQQALKKKVEEILDRVVKGFAFLNSELDRLN